MNVRLIGGILAVTLMVGGFIGSNMFYGPDAPTDGATDGTSLEALDADIQASGYRVFTVLKAQFPDDYQVFLSRLAQAQDQDAPPQELMELSRRTVEEIRQANAPNLQYAQDAAISTIVDMSRSLHQSVLEKLGPSACNRFAVAGPAGLGQAVADFAPAIDEQGALILETAGMARDTPRPSRAPAPATEEDWAAARALAVEMGTAPEDLAALQDLKVEDGNLCRGLVGLLTAILSKQDASGTRLRTTFVLDIVRN